MAADTKWSVYYNPQTVAGWAAQGKVACIGVALEHLLWHLLREHAARAQQLGVTARTAARGNVAACCEINRNQRGCWPNALTPVTADRAQLQGQLLEELYASAGTVIPEGSQLVGAGVGEGNCGACATGVPHGYEVVEGHVTALDSELIRRGVARDLLEHGKYAGIESGAMAWAEDVLRPPKVDWRTQLAAAVRAACSSVYGSADYTYQRPSRRQSCCPEVVLPSLCDPKVHAAVVIDKSGSMGEEEAIAAVAEVEGVMAAVGRDTPITLLYCDSTVVEKRQAVSARGLRAVGSGGTDMRVGIATALQLRPQPDVIIVLTDGFTPWPEAAPPVQLIAVIIGGGQETQREVPAWARTVIVD